MIAAAHASSSGSQRRVRRLSVVDHQIITRSVDQGVQHGVQVEVGSGSPGKSGIGIGGIGAVQENAYKSASLLRRGATDQDAIIGAEAASLSDGIGSPARKQVDLHEIDLASDEIVPLFQVFRPRVLRLLVRRREDLDHRDELPAGQLLNREECLFDLLARSAPTTLYGLHLGRFQHGHARSRRRGRAMPVAWIATSG